MIATMRLKVATRSSRLNDHDLRLNNPRQCRADEYVLASLSPRLETASISQNAQAISAIESR
ncbi:MAG: hypothetical protein ACKOYI_02125, partial [Actinomycetota bacterium]